MAPAPQVRQTASAKRPGSDLSSTITVLMAIQAIALSVLVGYEGPQRDGPSVFSSSLAITALAIRVGLRASNSWPGVVMVLLGTVGTVTGAGIGGVHLAKVGATTQAIAGLCALVTGLVLLFSGATSLWSGRSGLVAHARGSRSAGAVGVRAVPAHGGERHEPARDVAGTGSPSDHGLAYEDAAPDGGRCPPVRWYVPSHNGAALVLHGAGSTRSAVLSHGVVLARHGYGVLMLDTRGHGRSEGRAMDFGWFGDPDIHAAASFLARRADVDPERIGVVGLSMGGEQAIAAAGTDPRIKVAIAEGVTGMQAADHGWLPRGVKRDRTRPRVVLFEAADLMTDASKPMPMRDAIAAMGPKSLLLIAGGATTSEADAGRWLRAVSPSRRPRIVRGLGTRRRSRRIRSVGRPACSVTSTRRSTTGEGKVGTMAIATSDGKVILARKEAVDGSGRHRSVRIRGIAEVLSGVIVALMAVTSAIGLLNDDLYRDGAWAREALRGDLTTLVLVAPILAIGRPRPSRLAASGRRVERSPTACTTTRTTRSGRRSTTCSCSTSHCSRSRSGPPSLRRRASTRWPDRSRWDAAVAGSVCTWRWSGRSSAACGSRAVRFAITGDLMADIPQRGIHLVFAIDLSLLVPALVVAGSCCGGGRRSGRSSAPR